MITAITSIPRRHNTVGNLALFLLPAMTVTVPGGSSYAAALLVLAGCWLLLRTPFESLPSSARWLYWSLVPLALCWLLDGLLSGVGSSAFEKPVKILIAVLALYYLAKKPPSHMYLWLGASIGAFVGCLEAIYQVSHLGIPRASGGLKIAYIIHFGDLALLLGLLGLCAWHVPVRRQWLFRTWLLLSAGAGLLASVLSGTRGAWLAFAVVAGCYFIYLLVQRRYKIVGGVALALLAAITLALVQPSLRIQERVLEAKNEVSSYTEHGVANTSVGARLQMWHQAWKLYRERPVFGWQQRGYVEQQQLGIARKELDPVLAEFGHAHNEILNAAAKEGTVGLLALLLAYIGPFWTFARWFQSAQSPQLRAVTAAGMLVPISYFGFGLTESFLIRTAGITTYVYLLCLVWGAAWGLRQGHTNQEPAATRHAQV